MALGGKLFSIDGELRVQGQLNVTRSLGDVALRPFVCGTPEIVSFDLAPTDCLLMMCCDGVADSLDADDILNTVWGFVKARQPSG